MSNFPHFLLDFSLLIVTLAPEKKKVMCYVATDEPTIVPTKLSALRGDKGRWLCVCRQD